jgi:hypothetical protein
MTREQLQKRVDFYYKKYEEARENERKYRDLWTNASADYYSDIYIERNLLMYGSEASKAEMRKRITEREQAAQKRAPVKRKPKIKFDPEMSSVIDMLIIDSGSIPPMENRP